jgi:hypothetical protein
MRSAPSTKTFGNGECGRRARVEDAHGLLQAHRHAERGDQRREPRRVAQRPVGEALGEHGDADRHRGPGDEQQRQREPPLGLDHGRQQVR